MVDTADIEEISKRLDFLEDRIGAIERKLGITKPSAVLEEEMPTYRADEY